MITYNKDNTVKIRRVVIYENNLDDTYLYEKYLKTDTDHLYKITIVQDPRETVNIENTDVILISYNFPSCSGLEILNQLTNGDPASNPIPAIMLTEAGNENIAVKSLKEGAQDYIAKDDLTPEKLLNSVASTIYRTRVIKKILERQDKLEKLLIIDELTNTYNRRFFVGALQDEVERALRYKESLCLLIMDLDNFKQINDTFGHLTGDKVLCSFTQNIKSRIRACDILARYGGDEFCLLLPNSGIECGKEIAKNLLEIIHKIEILLDSGKAIRITFSTGIAALNDNIYDPKNLFDAADSALLHAKQSGRDKIAVALDSSINSQNLHQLNIIRKSQYH